MSKVQNFKKIRNFGQNFSCFFKVINWNGDFLPYLNQSFQCFNAKQRSSTMRQKLDQTFLKPLNIGQISYSNLCLGKFALIKKIEESVYMILFCTVQMLGEKVKLFILVIL